MKIAIDTTLSDIVHKIATICSKLGGTAYVVGGAVRDALLGKKNKDIDIEVFGINAIKLQAALSQTYPLDLVGLSFGIIKLKHYDIDIALPRRESKAGLGHKGFEIQSDPNLTIYEAAQRRDFTINAIYYNPLTDEIIDPYCGHQDLKNGILRHVSDKFSEDPLRVLRAMQFIARFNLTPAIDTIKLCAQMTPEGLPEERLMGEWQKLILKGQQISKGLDFLVKTNWIQYYPELNSLIGCKQDPLWHPEGDVFTHTCLSLDAFAKHRTGDDHEDLIIGLAVLCHDFGKPLVSKLTNGRIRALGHDVEGVLPCQNFLKRLTNQEEILTLVPPLVACHMRPYAIWDSKASDSAVRRLALASLSLKRLLLVVTCDIDGTLTPTQSYEICDYIQNAATRLAIYDSTPKPIIQGRDLISLGLSPSPLFGKILHSCFEAQLDGLFSSHDDGIIYLKNFLINTNQENSSLKP